LREIFDKLVFPPFDPENDGQIVPGDLLKIDDDSYILVGDINSYYGGCVNCCGQDEYQPIFPEQRIVGRTNILNYLRVPLR
jgi:hypothetical protein